MMRIAYEQNAGLFFEAFMLILSSADNFNSVMSSQAFNLLPPFGVPT